MPFPTQITVPQLSRLIGLPDSPVVLDVRASECVRADPLSIPAARRHDAVDVADAVTKYRNSAVVVACEDGGAPSQGFAAWLRAQGVAAQTLEGGYGAWRRERQPLVRTERLPQRDLAGRTIWVTRARPKIVRIACPWFIRRFLDRDAVFLFVSPGEVLAVAERYRATPFDIDDCFWSDRGEHCTFDVMVAEFGLQTEALLRLALIVRGADTGRLELAPQCAGLLSAALGYSRMYRDDLAQLDAAMSHYDAMYRWCRDATEETHT